MSVEPAALAPGCSHEAGCPPDAWPISMARENVEFLRKRPTPFRVSASMLAQQPSAEQRHAQTTFAWHVVCVIGSGVHLFASLAAHGWHPAAWRVTRRPGF